MADDNARDKGPDWGAITKWIVLGIVLIVLIIVLKEPLGGLVNRATDVKVSSKGVEIHTAQTAVGEVKFSQEKITNADLNKQKEDNPNVQTFISDKHYSLSWPKGIWRKDDEKLNYARSISPSNNNYIIDMVCMRTMPSQSGFTPNIYVSINYVDPNSSLQELMNNYQNNVLRNARIITEQIDEVTQGAIAVYTMMNYNAGMELYCVQRFVRSNGIIYTITATTTPTGDDQTKSEILAILNSFKIVEA